MPNSPSLRERRKESERQRARQSEFRRISEAIDKLKDVLLEGNVDHDQVISWDEFRNAMNQVGQTRRPPSYKMKQSRRVAK